MNRYSACTGDNIPHIEQTSDHRKQKSRDMSRDMSRESSTRINKVTREKPITSINGGITKEGSSSRIGGVSEEVGTSADTGTGLEKGQRRKHTRNLKLVKKFKGQRFPIIWKNRRPVGEQSKLFKSECTALVRQAQNVPLQVKGWKEVPLEKKKKLFDNILEHFIMEGREKLVLEQMSRSYKNYKNSLKNKYYDPYEDDVAKARANYPPDFAQDDWNYLVNLWSDKEWKEMCNKNKENHAKNHIIHTTGSKSFQQWKEEEEEKTGQEIDRVQMFELTLFNPLVKQ